MTREMDMVMEALNRADSRIDKLSDGMTEVSSHLATLIERTDHLATREDLSTSIRLHAEGCSGRTSIAAKKSMSSATIRLLKALAGFLVIAGTAIAAYFGFGEK